MRWISGLRRCAKHWRKDRSGSTAIEFGMVIGPFLGLLFAIIEVALVYFAQFAMESGNEAASRVLRTGQAQNGNLTQALFKWRVCQKLPAFMDCNGNLTVDVRSYPTFAQAAVNAADLFGDDGARNTTPEKFCPGGPSEVRDQSIDRISSPICPPSARKLKSSVEGGMGKNADHVLMMCR